MVANINYWAVLLAGIAFWFVGMIWFSLIFGKVWSKEITKHGIKIKKPNTKDMATKSIATFIFNLIVSFGIAIIVDQLGLVGLGSAVLLGLLIGIIFAALPMLTSYLWESRHPKLSLIDIGYPIVGIVIATIIITLWA